MFATNAVNSSYLYGSNMYVQRFEKVTARLFSHEVLCIHLVYVMEIHWQ